ncbi:MAG TPA: hypothetical protein VEA69_16810 [Tepidisphaeraceae bacterium]|nr:hypothetical protein [Tepidisphaeraceae bacterium]
MKRKALQVLHWTTAVIFWTPFALLFVVMFPIGAVSVYAEDRLR